MPLRVTLKPHERLIINGAAIRNGARSADLLMETHCKFLRESEILREGEADTACKKLCFTLQLIHLSDEPAEAENLLYAQAIEILGAMPSAAPYLASISEAVAEKQTHRAIKVGRQLVAYEASLLERARGRAGSEVEAEIEAQAEPRLERRAEPAAA